MNALVTGGGGFLGGAIVRRLLARGDAVRSFTRTAYPWLDELGVAQFHGDLSDAEAVARAAAGCDLVFHTAAKAGVWGRYRDFHGTNVVGTRNVLAACKRHGVSRLVYSSTPSVVHGGGSLDGVNESAPYPERFEAHYPQTKAVAEKAVLAANGDSLATVALRPHLIWGPGDPHLIPRVVARARAGRLRRVGAKPVTVDITYIDNAADAHLLAADKLRPGSAIAGRAYFITNGEPVELWDFLNRVFAAAGVPPVTRTVSVWKAKLAGRVLEGVYRLLRLPGEPAMTRFVASQLSTSHWYDITAARRDLGYEPRVSIDEGLKRLAETFSTPDRV
jgi:nucleoside-diphosphate-sugar epimerase